MSFINGFGAYLPETVVTNDELATKLKCDPEWIFTASGIRERRQASDNDTVAEMAARAARACIERAQVSVDQVGLVIVACGTSPRRFPGPAAEVAVKLNVSPGTATLDVPMASAGALYGMALADALAPHYGSVLIIGAERMTEVAWREPADANTAILFGDGAGACLITRETGSMEIVDHTLHSDGSFTRDLRFEHDGALVMEGRSVILQASRKIPAALTALLARNNWPAAEVDALLMHQANKNLMNRVAQSVGFPHERVFSVIEKTGNTSSASMLIAAAEWVGNRTLIRGQRVAFAAFGAGFHWGALLARAA